MAAAASTRSLSFCLNVWQDYSRGMIGAMVDGLLGDLQLRVSVLISRRVMVPIVIGKVGTRDIQPNAMAWQKRIRSGVHFNGVANHFTGLDQ